MTLPIDRNAVPSHLRVQAGDPLNTDALGGVVGTMAPARISYRGSKFRLVDKDGVEADPFVTNDKGMAELENNGVAMDIVIVGANPFISKIYYDKPYDPDADTAPACFSDNGVAPSERSGKPQSVTCAACPHNVWGSAVNPSTGKARQACNNVKKLAVVRYRDEGNTVYALGLPGASLKPYEAAMRAVTSHGYSAGGIIWRISFDREVAFPKLDFKAVGFLDEESMAEFQAIQKTDEVRLATGRDDVAMAAAAIEAHRGANVNRPTDSLPRGDWPRATHKIREPQRLDLPEAKRLEKTISGPMAAKPARPEPVPTVTPLGMPEHTRTAMAQAQAQPESESTERRGRGRPRKYPEGDAGIPPPPSQAVPNAPARPAGVPPLPDPKQGPGELPATTSEMDDALSRAMGIQI